MKRHKRDCPFAQRVVVDTIPGWSPACICGPCDHPPEWVRPGVLTGAPFCDFCKTPLPVLVPITPPEDSPEEPTIEEDDHLIARHTERFWAEDSPDAPEEASRNV